VSGAARLCAVETCGIIHLVTATVYGRALIRAAELLGGRDKLARVLRVPAAEIDKWIAGESKPPREVFLRVVDLILDETGPAADDTDAQDPPPRDAAGSSQRYYD
jgi:hypothetical protein